MEPILSDLPFRKGDNVLMFVNGLGGTPQIELYIVYRKAAEIATARPPAGASPSWATRTGMGDCPLSQRAMPAVNC